MECNGRVNQQTQTATHKTVECCKVAADVGPDALTVDSS